jgi:hypothetical protein
MNEGLFRGIAEMAGFEVKPLHQVDTTLPHAEGEAAALVVVNPATGLVHGCLNPHTESAGLCWFLGERGYNLAAHPDSSAFYARCV